MRSTHNVKHHLFVHHVHPLAEEFMHVAGEYLNPIFFLEIMSKQVSGLGGAFGVPYSMSDVHYHENHTNNDLKYQIMT